MSCPVASGPQMSENRRISSALRVRLNVAASPISISSKVRLSGKIRLDSDSLCIAMPRKRFPVFLVRWPGRKKWVEIQVSKELGANSFRAAGHGVYSCCDKSVCSCAAYRLAFSYSAGEIIGRSRAADKSVRGNCAKIHWHGRRKAALGAHALPSPFLERKHDCPVLAPLRALGGVSGEPPILAARRLYCPADAGFSLPLRPVVRNVIDDPL